MQFHFAPLPQHEVESILKAHAERSPSQVKLAAQLSEGSPGLAMEMDVEEAVEKRKTALRILERAARGQGSLSSSRTPMRWQRIANPPSRNCRRILRTSVRPRGAHLRSEFSFAAEPAACQGVRRTGAECFFFLGHAGHRRSGRTSRGIAPQFESPAWFGRLSRLPRAARRKRLPGPQIEK